MVVGASATGVQIAARGPALGPRRRPRRRGARPRAAPVPGPGHPLVDGGRGRARRALRRGGRHRPGATRPLHAARGLRRAGDVRSQRAHRHRDQAGRPARRHQRRSGAVLRFPPQQVRAGRSQAGTAPRHHRRVGGGQRGRRLGATAASVRAHRGGRLAAARDSTSTRGEIETVIWATGFRPDYSWLDVDVLDHKGMVRHEGGVVDSPGMYLIGTPFLRRRKSSFIDGARADAEDLVVELADVPRRPGVRGRARPGHGIPGTVAASALRSGSVGTERPPVVRQKGQDRAGPDEDRDLLHRDGHLGHPRTLERGAFDQQGAPAPRWHDHRA